MILLFAILLLAIIAACLVALSVLYLMAPEGYEDETGFHYGRKS